MQLESGGLMMALSNIASGTEGAGQSARFWKGDYSATFLSAMRRSLSKTDSKKESGRGLRSQKGVIESSFSVPKRSALRWDRGHAFINQMTFSWHKLGL